MDTKTHWEKVYTTKAPDAVSWYRTHLETSLALIERAVDARSASIIDVGGGESTLVDDLLLRGYKNITVLDVSQSAIDSPRAVWVRPRSRCVGLSPISRKSNWNRVRTTFGMIAPSSIFLPHREQRIAYVRQVARSVKPGGHVIVSTFGPEGPTKCSGLEVMRYDADSLHSEFGTTLPPGREFQGDAPHAVWNYAAIPILLLPDRLKLRRTFSRPANLKSRRTEV